MTTQTKLILFSVTLASKPTPLPILFLKISPNCFNSSTSLAETLMATTLKLSIFTALAEFTAFSISSEASFSFNFESVLRP